MTCQLRTNPARASLAGIAISSLTIALSAFQADDRWSTAMFRIGLACVILCCTAWCVIQSTVSADMVEHARQAGWDDGYENGFSDGLGEGNVLRLVEPSSLSLPLAANSSTE